MMIDIWIEFPWRRNKKKTTSVVFLSNFSIGLKLERKYRAANQQRNDRSFMMTLKKRKNSSERANYVTNTKRKGNKKKDFKGFWSD